MPDAPRTGRLVTSLQWLVVAYVGQKVATLTAIVFLARYFGERDFGGFAIALAIPTALEALTDLGLGWALVREGAGRPEVARALTVAALPPKLALGVLTVGASYAIASSLSLPEDVVVAAVLLAVARALDSLTYLGRALFQAYERMEFDAAAQLLDAVVRLTLTVYAVIGGFGITGLAKAMVVAAAIVLAGTAAIAMHRFLRPVRLDLALLPGLFIAGLPLAAIWLLDGLALRVGVIFVGDALGKEAAGNLAAATRLIEPLLGVASLAATALLPLSTRHLVEERGTIPWLFHATVKVATIGGLAATIVLVGMGSRLVDAVFGEGFAQARDLIRPLALSITPLFVVVVLTPLLLAMRRQASLIGAHLVAIVVNAIVLMVGQSMFGPAAAALGLLACEVAVIVVLLALVPDLRMPGVIGALGVVWLVVPASLGLALAPVIGDIAGTVLSLAILMAGVRIFGVIDPREIAYLEGAGFRFGRLGRMLLAPLR